MLTENNEFESNNILNVTDIYSILHLYSVPMYLIVVANYAIKFAFFWYFSVK